ncbi:hypothetical protein NEMIN01_2346 [Nematocida minor]|uniref:uncharacterized protein n=1 Tax=Nematocida minor TaxID=1912983 RepID=UPI00221F9650|nr:uncharacterized protein NEMIN01_2346 [Nematocida minor]KAI5193002.1 hypothetical protein NEMIN01_2346 [Nematocida minor]
MEDKQHSEIAQENSRAEKNLGVLYQDREIKTRHKIARCLRRGIEWGLGVFSCLLFIKGLYSDALKNGAGSVLPKIVILSAVGVSIYSWKKAISSSALSRKEEHLFYHKTVLGIIIGLFGAISGNPWLLFVLTSRSLNTHLFVFMLFTHIVIGGSVFFINNAAIRQIISMYPTIATTIVNFEEILSEKGMHCTYQKSRKYLLGLSITFVSFCIIGFCFSPYVADVHRLSLQFSEIRV